ncbi:hypothetical protein BBJ29_004955 [Phytophthora kernoviae]|uniref:Uncharacterized protein n=1 Tax=Phytophthora kernoviae TaxID=325452 RepID=A0A421GA90_9STRA|nr:hypothetical protein BBJ29_004955 [Phytophthora kernoviae]
MEAQTTHEKQRLQNIQIKANDVQEKLNTRLPTQQRHLTALVCAIKWRLQTLKPTDALETVKKVRTELGAFDYRTKEQAELLTRYLCELDDILSYGDNEIKAARKALVVYIQKLLLQADAFKKRSAKLKEFGEQTLSVFQSQTPQIPSAPTPSDSGAESDDLHVKALYEEEEDNESEEDEDEEMEQDDKGMEPEAEEEEEEDVAPPQKKSPRLQPAVASRATDDDIDVNSLPVWRPYYQLQRRQDGIYLIARLNDIDPRNVRVQWNDHTGVLRIDGYRLPTQKDIVMSRLSGAPTFGRFEIVEQFPRNMLNMNEATQQVFENGTLQIRMPYHLVQNPRRHRPMSISLRKVHPAVRVDMAQLEEVPSRQVAAHDI